MAAAVNNRVFYAIEAVGFQPDGVVASGGAPSGFVEAHGVQSVGITTTFNLEQVFELSQLELYENIEGVPDIEMTAQKVIDGYPLLYHLATPTASSPSLVGRSTSKAGVAFNIYPDTNENASGVPIQSVFMSGMFVSALTYTLNVEGNCTEDVTLVGNDKEWFQSGTFFAPNFDGTDEPLAINGSGGVQRREDVLMGSGVSGSIWPTEIPGIDASGFNLQQTGNAAFNAHIQTTTISTDLGREELFELGRRGNYFRFVNFPTEVTCAIELTSSEGDLIDALADPVGGNNLTDQQIKIFLREGTILDLGSKNKLSSSTMGGGDAGGGNMTVTYNYSNFNSLAVSHPQDPAGL